jgi:hypothetical protein
LIEPNGNAPQCGWYVKTTALISDCGRTGCS